MGEPFLQLDLLSQAEIIDTLSALLSTNTIGQQALSDRGILRSVVQHKEVFFHAGYANYQDCLKGSFRLLPDEDMQKELQKDYQQMIDAGMFNKEPPLFEAILDILADLEKQLNT